MLMSLRLYVSDIILPFKRQRFATVKKLQQQKI